MLHLAPAPLYFDILVRVWVSKINNLIQDFKQLSHKRTIISMT